MDNEIAGRQNAELKTAGTNIIIKRKINVGM